MILTMRADMVRFRNPGGGMGGGGKVLTCKPRGGAQIWALGPRGWVKVEPSPIGTKNTYWESMPDGSRPHL